MSEIEKYYNGEIIVDFEEETELEKNYNEVAELYSKAVKKKIEYRKEIERLNNIINELEKKNEILKHRLNDIIFDDANDDVELGARYLRKIGYIDFDEERKVYLNKHNEEPFWQNDEREKDYYIKDEELNEYTKQLEFKLQQKENTIKEVREFVGKWKWEDGDGSVYFDINTNPDDLLRILDKGE